MNNDNKTLTASEALFGFIGWVSSQDTPVTISSKSNLRPIVDLVVQFCKAQGLEELQDGWFKKIKEVKEVKEEDDRQWTMRS